MFNLQGSEIIFILLLALVFLGPEKLPDAIRRFTRTYGELRKMGSGFQSELRSVIDEPMREARETAGLLRDAADPNKIAEAESSTPLTPETPSAAEEPPDEHPGPTDPAANDDVAPVDEESHGSEEPGERDEPPESVQPEEPGEPEAAVADTAGSPEEPAAVTDDAAGRHRAART